jgi:ABC-2 type transport system permease protein
MTNLRIFFYGGVFSYRALFAWQSPAVYIGTMLGAPVFQVLFFTYLGRASGHTGADAAFFIVGNSIAVCGMGGIFGMVQSIAGERWTQTLTPIIATPANRAALFIGRALPSIANAMLVCAVAFTVSALVTDFDLDAARIPMLALIVAVSAFSCTGLGMVVAAIGIRKRGVFTVANPTYFLLLLFAGVEAPLAAFPQWVQTVGNVVPLTHGITAARQTVGGTKVTEEHFGQKHNTPVDDLLLTELRIGVFYFIAGYVLLRIFELQARRRGSMEER